MDNSEHIDFEKEIKEFIDKKYLLSVKVLAKDNNSCKFHIFTLENEEYEIHCSVSEGIQVFCFIFQYFLKK